MTVSRWKLGHSTFERQSLQMKTWNFWDWWHIEHQNNIVLAQGRPKWVPEGTYEDPTFDYLASWPTVYRDETENKWRMLYPASGFPLTLMGAESDDGIRWRPLDAIGIDPGGQKLATNHLFTVERANGGPVYIDPDPADGYPFKFYCVQRGGRTAKSTRLEENSGFHELVTGQGATPYAAENLVVRSKDGQNWEIDRGGTWTAAGWHPDPPMLVYFNPGTQRHIMMTRPGWGDRRLATVDSADGREWGNLQWVLQPDPEDGPDMQFYGMAVHRVGPAFVGFLYMAHFGNAEPLARFNQLWGPVDCQLAYSFDGLHWLRGLREPFIGVNEPDQPGSGLIYPTALIETETELRIYSTSTPNLHFQHPGPAGASQFTQKGQIPPSAILLHTLRKDGFTYLASGGNWGEFITKPLVLLTPQLSVNLLAPSGEALFELTDLESRPLEGFRFEDSAPATGVDALNHPLQWKGKLETLMDRPVRLHVRLRNARLHAVGGEFHFADALDVVMLADGSSIDPSLFDF